MNISNNMTQKQLEEILISIYKKANESKEIKAIDIVNEIKQNILRIYSSNSVDTRYKIKGNKQIGS